MKILFLGKTFPSSRDHLRLFLPGDCITDAWPQEVQATEIRADVLIPTMCRVDAPLMDVVRPRLIQQFGVGLEGVDVPAATTRRIPVANVSAADTGNATAVAELALMHLLVLFRRYREAREGVHAGLLGEPAGETLAGKTAAVIGLGAVGREVAARLHSLGVRVIAVGRDRLPPGSSPAANVDEYFPAAEMRSALAHADCVVVCASLNDATRGLLGERELAAMRRGGFLVNVARGPVVQYEALRTALRTGQLAGAGLDVFWEEPIDPTDPILRENVSVTPHVGGITHSSYTSIARAVADNVERLRRGDPIRNCVNGGR